MKKFFSFTTLCLHGFLLLACLLYVSPADLKAQELVQPSPPLLQGQKEGMLLQSLQRNHRRNHPHVQELERLFAGGRASFASAAEGDQAWSDNYHLSGTNGHLSRVLEAGDKLIVGGSFSTIGKTVAHNIAVWDGQAWSSLGGGTNGGVSALAWHQGHLYVGGNFTEAGGVRANGIARWDGNRWHPVSTQEQVLGVSLGFVSEILSDESNGLLYIGGSFAHVDGIAGTSNLAVWNGTAWASVGNGTDGMVTSLLLHQNRLYVGGGFQQVGGNPYARVTYFAQGQWHPMGTGDSPADNLILDLTLGEEGSNSILAGGAFRMIDGHRVNGIARYAIATNSWSALGNGDQTGVAFQGQGGEVKIIRVVDGAVYVGGNFDTAGGVKAEGISVYRQDRGFMAVGKGVSHNVFDLLVQHKEILLFGGFKAANGGLYGERNGQNVLNPGDTLAYGLARTFFDPENPGATITWRTFSENPFYGTDGHVNKVLVHKGELYVAGSFTVIGHTRAKNIAKWDGSNWIPLDAGVGSGFINDMVSVGNDLYVGGYFALQTADGKQSALVARWDGQEWHPLGLGVGGYVHSQVFALETDGTNLYVGGLLLELAGNPDGSIVPIANIAKWDGRTWASLGEGLDLDGIVNTILYHKGALYAGGWINLPGNTTTMTDLAMWDGNGWRSAGLFNNRVLTLLGDGDTLYAGGIFDAVNQTSTGALVRKNASNVWEGIGGIAGGGSSGVSSLLKHNGYLFVGGKFTQVGGLSGSNSIAYLDREGRWQAMGSGATGGGGAVLSLLVKEERLWVGGSFQATGGKPALGLATWQYPGIITSLPAAPGTSEPALATLFPNPTTGTVTLIGQQRHITGLTLRDLSGKVRMQLTFSPTLEKQLSLGALPAGLYLAEIRTSGGVQLRKLVVR